jgi:tRNA G26 N,N-dimethylase Trm1
MSFREGLVDLSTDAAVFYNPSQVINRDLTVLVLNAFLALRGNSTPHGQRRMREVLNLDIHRGGGEREED